MKTTVNERVKQARTKLHLSQNYVANFLGINRTAVVEIESGKRKISAEELYKYSILLNISADELLNGKNTQILNTIFARKFNELDEKDQEEILNLIDFKKHLKEKIK